MNKPKHEIDDDGKHRIVCGDSIGEWVSYRAIATLLVKNKNYLAVTEYFDGSLPTETVIEWKAV